MCFLKILVVRQFKKCSTLIRGLVLSVKKNGIVIETYTYFHLPKYDSYLGGTQYHMKINGMHINIFDE